jgi:hypothetical protein
MPKRREAGVKLTGGVTRKAIEEGEREKAEASEVSVIRSRSEVCRRRGRMQVNRCQH